MAIYSPQYALNVDPDIYSNILIALEIIGNSQVSSKHDICLINIM